MLLDDYLLLEVLEPPAKHVFVRVATRRFRRKTVRLREPRGRPRLFGHDRDACIIVECINAWYVAILPLF